MDIFGLIKRWWTRLGLGGAALVALAMLLASPSDWPPNVPTLIAFLAALGAWIVSELPTKAPHPHDVALFDQLMGLFSDDYRTLLREQDFGAPFAADRLDPGYQLDRQLVGKKYGFEDKVLSRRLDTVRTICAEFCELTATRLYAMNGNFLTAKTNEDERTGMRSKATLDATERMNSLANQLLREIESLDQVGRRRLHTPIVQP